MFSQDKCWHAESIAFYNGEHQEASCASLRLALLVAVVRIRIIWTTFLALWTNFYQHATYLLPSILTAPRYFAGEVEFGVITQACTVHAPDDNRQYGFPLQAGYAPHAKSLSDSLRLTQVSFAFNRIESALSYILAHLQELSGLAAQAERLDALLSGANPPWTPGACCMTFILYFLGNYLSGVCSCPAAQHARPHH